MTTSAPIACVLRAVLVDAWRKSYVTAAANDNGHGELHDNLLRDALTHFGRFGLSAAESARNEAERAFFAGDRKKYRHWLGVCRALDRRLAASLLRRTGHEAAPSS